MTAKIIIIPILLVLLAIGVYGFSVMDTFTGTGINTTNFFNRSGSSTILMNVSGGVLNMYGNNSAATGLGGGVYITSKNYINLTSNGDLSFYFRVVNTFNANQYFYGGLIPAGAALGGGGSGLVFTIQGADSYYLTDIKTGLRACGGASIALDNTQHIVRMTATRINDLDTRFDNYFDGTLWCSVTQANTISNLYANLTMVNGAVANTYHYLIIDNLYFTDNQTTGSGFFAVGDPCRNNADCISQNCEYRRCALKVGGKSCLSSAECLSGACVNSLCSFTDIWQNMEASKNQMFGNSVQANNMVSLFIILGGAFGLGMATMSIILPIIWVGLTTIAFTIFGWLSPFILVGLFLMGLIVVVLGVVIGGSKG